MSYGRTYGRGFAAVERPTPNRRMGKADHISIIFDHRLWLIEGAGDGMVAGLDAVLLEKFFWDNHFLI